MADTPDLGSGPVRGGGSSPLSRTIWNFHRVCVCNGSLHFPFSPFHPTPDFGGSSMQERALGLRSAKAVLALVAHATNEFTNGRVTIFLGKII